MIWDSFIRKQFLDVLQWNEESDGVLSWRYPMQDFEIQNGATLVVRESQAAIFVNEGQIADVFSAGTHTLTTQTLPILTNLKNWDKFFDSPFKSDVYFFSTRLQTGRKWGTAQPITLRDRDFDMIRLRAFGMYSYRIANPKLFFTEMSGTRDIYTVEDIEEQLLGILLSTMASSLGASQISFLDMAANQAMMAQYVKKDIASAFEKYGLLLDTFNITSLTLPEPLQIALDERIAATMKGSLSNRSMSGFTQYQVANSIPLAAQNEGGLAGLGAGLSSGMVFGQVMAQGLNNAMSHNTASEQNTPSPQQSSTTETNIEERLEKLKTLFDKLLISEKEYQDAKSELLKKLLG